MKYAFLILILSLSACHDSLIDERIVPDSPITESEMPIEKYSVSVCQLIDELGLCENFDWNKPEDCYTKNYRFEFFSMTANGLEGKYILLNEAGGSGGDNIAIYERNEGGLLLVQEKFAFMDSILPTSTLGVYDLILLHRDYDRGYIHVLYQWNGKKFQETEVMDINGIPMKFLEAMKVAKEKFSDLSFVSEFDGVGANIYYELKVDTLFGGEFESIYSVTIGDHQESPFEKCWIIHRKEGSYELVSVAGTSIFTNEQDEFGKRDYRSIRK